ELPAPDCPPVRIRLLGENLIAFRTTSGRIGMIQDACPHRGASMFFGRNEEDGLRCVYHGWKFDVSGACVDMPSEPPESNFKNKVRTRAYPVQERAGIVWTYMGPRETPPPLPQLEATMIEGARPQLCLMECNWLQTLEGDLDTSHLGFLHLGAVKPEDSIPGSYDYYMVTDRAPRYEVIDTEVGTTYGAYRPAEPDTTYWRIAHFMFPFYALIPTGDLGRVIRAQAWVPLDDENTMYWGWQIAGTVAGRPGQQATERNAATGRPVNAAGRGGFDYLPRTSDWLGRYRLDQNKDNDYGIDRAAQARGESFTGIRGVRQQDKAVAESMGPIYDRTREHLGTSDSMIIRTRRRLLRALKAYMEEDAPPPGVDRPELYRTRSGSIILPRGADWLAATEHLRNPKVPIGAPAVAGEAGG
ncbi:MAG TPA: Rieske 2Fe-2S domain-containing protein, partial [Dehalococcoidia bacterium]|nr:Rieske 2Fe-2S domain-containing protein [Dehalococcoidia bacterium]